MTVIIGSRWKVTYTHILAATSAMGSVQIALLGNLVRTRPPSLRTATEAVGVKKEEQQGQG